MNSQTELVKPDRSERRRNSHLNDLTELLMVLTFVTAVSIGWLLIYLWS